MPRLSELTDREALPEEAREAFDYLVKTRGSARGAFAIGLRSPQMSQRIAHVGSYVRFESPLPKAVRELAGVTASSVMDNPFEVNGHARAAKEAGVADAVIEAAKSGAEPVEASEEEALVIACARELTQKFRLSNKTYEAMKKAFGEAGVVDLVGIVGYYAMLSCYQNGLGINEP